MHGVISPGQPPRVPRRRRIVVGISGASGTIYGVRLLARLPGCGFIQGIGVGGQMPVAAT